MKKRYIKPSTNTIKLSSPCVMNSTSDTQIPVSEESTASEWGTRRHNFNVWGDDED